MTEQVFTEQCLQKPLAICLNAQSVERLSGMAIRTATELLSLWMSESRSMLPKSADELIDLLSHGRYAIVVRGTEVVGGCGWTFEHIGPTEAGEKKVFHELGGGIVSPHARKQGIGTAAVLSAMVMQALFGQEGTGLIALPNHLSRGIIEGELGGVQYTTQEAVEQLPRIVYSAGCASCPNRPSDWDPEAPMETLVDACCDTVWKIPPLSARRSAQ